MTALSLTTSEVIAMGSTGSGRFSDYSGSGRSSSGSGGDGGAGGGGSSGVDPCEQAFSCALEEVAQCEYYEKNAELPEEGTEVEIVIDGRLVAIDGDGVTIGAIPTRFNYIAGCIEDGYEYVGVVSSASETPIPSVSVDFMTDE